MFSKYLSFVQFHERLILVLAGLLVLYIGGKHWIDRSYDTAVAKNAVAQQQLQDQVQKNAELEKQQEARVQQYTQLVDTLTKQNQTLVSGIVARNQAVQVQQTKDVTLPLSDLASRQNLLAGTTGVSATETGLAESPTAAVQVTQQLESLPVLEQNVKDQQTELGNKDKQIDGLNGVVTGLNGQVAGCKAEVTDSKAACDARIKLEKAKGRKKLITGLKIGAAIGAAIVAVLTHL